MIAFTVILVKNITRPDYRARTLGTALVTRLFRSLIRYVYEVQPYSTFTHKRVLIDDVAELLGQI